MDFALEEHCINISSGYVGRTGTLDQHVGKCGQSYVVESHTCKDSFMTSKVKLVGYNVTFTEMHEHKFE